MREIGAMYGNEGAYFSRLPDGHQNYVWIELIGFDNTLPDFGTEALLSRMGYIPDGFLLLISSLDFLHTHTEMSTQTDLIPQACSYNGHPCNDERERQVWTNHQLRALIALLKARGIAVYLSLFDFVQTDGAFATAHPELLTQFSCKGVLRTGAFIHITKRFHDGTFYQDYFIQQVLRVLRDYDFTGVHLADGVIRPRLPLQNAELSDDMLQQAHIPLPPADADREQYIVQHYREAWLDFCTSRWMEYLETAIPAFADAGFHVIVNSCWTKDPLESLYRYGVDYARLFRLPLTAVVVENGAPTISILDDAANAGYHMSCEDRRNVHHTFRASLMHIAAQADGAVALRPLFPVRDTMEQYDVIHQLPTALQRHAAAMFFCHRKTADGALVPVAAGNTYCLGDGLSSDNWRFLRLCSDNAYLSCPTRLLGGTVVWSDARNRAEVTALIRHRTPSSNHWVAALLSRGAMINTVVHIRHLDTVSGTLIVPNPHLLPTQEQEMLRRYDRGEIIYLSLPTDAADFTKLPNPDGMGFPYPLHFSPLPEEMLSDAVIRINQGCPTAETYTEECRLQMAETGENTARILVENEAYYYITPTIETHRPISCVRDITKNAGHHLRYGGSTFTALVPLRGVAIIEVTFASANAQEKSTI
ncbi:MAG: hypothetical protein J6L00_06265 [Clostridia bacterium]|nr:hypothetical protein [Clostridia bacterium]